MNRLANLICVLAGLTSPVVAQTTPTLGRVKVQQAVVRCAPGEQSPETGKLEFGSYVTVVAKEGNDWLCIQPPPGSISWVNWALVEPQKRQAGEPLSPPFNAVITIEKGASALIRAGKVGEDKPLNAQRTKLPNGTIVQVIGSKKKLLLEGDSTETNWYPIAAPADDYRFIRRDAVEWSGTPVSSGFVVRDGNSTEKPLPGKVQDKTGGSGDFTVSIGDRPRPSGSKWDPNEHPKFREAEKARGNGDTILAEKLYQQIADEVSPKGPYQDIDLANLCYDRIFLLRQGSNTSSGGTTETLRTPKLTENPKVETKYASSGEGYLRATRYKIAGAAVYALVDQKGIVRHYVVSGGVDLEKYLGKWVTLSGEEAKPEELRGDPLLTAKVVKTGQ